MTPSERLHVTSRVDVDRVRRAARRRAQALGLGREDAECVALASIELATNLVRYARDGHIELISLHDERRGVGVEVRSADAGPGILDLEKAMQDGFSTGGGMGSGLPGVRRLMDEMEIHSDARGTRVVARKWAKQTT